MTDLRQIADDIYSKEKTNSHKDLVVNYEKYKDVLDKYDYNDSQEKYDLFLQLKADYAIALAEIESYSKALPQIHKAVDLFTSDKQFDPEKIYSIKFYELLIWNRGRSNYYLENYSLAKSDFELLTKQYPDNIIYKKWLTATTDIKKNKIKNILWYCAAGSVLIESFLDKWRVAKNIFLVIGLLCLIVVVGLEINIYLRKKKYVA
jgi:tetratricopeptide (TPR) repeat protein